MAVLKDGEVAYEGAAVNRLTHSVNLMPMIEEALGRAGLDVSEIGLYAAVTGPGSFTGVRIGVSARQGHGPMARASPAWAWTRWRRWPQAPA